MSLKEWLGKIAGPRGYGDSLGTATIENSRVLSQALESSCEIINANAVGTSNVRSVLDRKALAFTYFVTSNGARQYMKSENVAPFHHGLALSVVRSAVSEGLFRDAATAQAELMADLALIDHARPKQVLNMEQPGSDDVLGLLLETVRNKMGDVLTFSTAGEHNFADIARILAKQTLKSIASATERYRW